MAVLTTPPEVSHPTQDILSQIYTFQVSVHDCSVLHQALLDAPIRCMTVKGVELTLLDVFPHFGLKMDGTHVKLAEPPPPPKKERCGEGDSQDLVSPVEETGRSLATVSSRTIHDIQSLIFKLVISADGSVETKALCNGMVIPYTPNMCITVSLKDVHMRSRKSFVNTSEKAYTLHPWGATLSACEKSSMVVFWDELQALWDQYRVSEYHCVCIVRSSWKSYVAILVPPRSVYSCVHRLLYTHTHVLARCTLRLRACHIRTTTEVMYVTYTHTHTDSNNKRPLLHLLQGVAHSPSVPNGDTPKQSTNTKDPPPTDTPSNHGITPSDGSADKEVKPLYELSMVGKCECSACISSVAAKYTQVRM